MILNIGIVRTHPLAVLVVPIITLWAVLMAVHFPYDTDDPVRREDAIRAFYSQSYGTSANPAVQNTAMVKQAQTAKHDQLIEWHVSNFVRRFKLENVAVLDVGSGSGYLQDVVTNYTGIDISENARRHYHKRFVTGTATAMPFKDNEFDAAWSIWVLEHIPNPEAALSEIRRVVKSGGVLYLRPAWNVAPWAAQGIEARPFRDLPLSGILTKATIPLRRSQEFWFVTTVPGRLLRSLAHGPSRLHYRRLEPNYQQYWQADSDAVNNLDMHELALWFTSRGDECLSCATRGMVVFQPNEPLVIRLRK